MLHVLVISLVEHLWNKIKSDYGCPKKKRWHAKKHDPPKKKREKRGNHVSKKTAMIRERKDITLRSKPYSSIHPSTHTLAPFDRDCMTYFSMDPLFDFTINRIQVCPVPILPWAPQRLVVVGKIKGKHCPGKKIQDECLERVILELCHVFKNLSKKCLQMDWGSMNKYCFMHHSNSQQPKTRRQLKNPLRE